ncbi:retinoic acid-induced protein 3-like [Polypterus senegalus]
MIPAITLVVLFLLFHSESSNAQDSNNTSSVPAGCGSNLGSDYYLLCDKNSSWGIVLETLATAGVVVSLVLMIILVGSVPFVKDRRKRANAALLFFFLLGTFGLFGLTFAFIIKSNERTCPTRIFLFGVLFAMCFSSLFCHNLRLMGLVRNGKGFVTGGWAVALLIALTLVQVIIAIEWLITVLVRDNQLCNYFQYEFVTLLIYVMFLLVLAWITSLFVFCGVHKEWKKHGAFVFLTTDFTICIWVVWIIMLTRGNVDINKRPLWDDPVLSIALVSNAWVFILFYVIPEIHYLNCGNKDDIYDDATSAMPTLTYQKHGLENQMFRKDEGDDDLPKDNHLYMDSPYDSTLPMRNLGPSRDFSIPRPHTKNSENGPEHPYNEYYGRKP